MNKVLKENRMKKLIIMGLDKSGKTSVFLSLKGIRNLMSFYSINPTRGIKREKINVFGSEFHVWDFGGQEQFRKILSIYASGLNGAILMFDLSSIKRSLRNLDFWWTLLNRWGKVPIILIGTKFDLINEKQYELYKDLITEAITRYEFVEYVETSSKIGMNINKTFELLVRSIKKSN